MVVVFCYELFCYLKDIHQVPVLRYACKKDIDKSYEYLEQVLSRIGYNGAGLPESKKISSSIKRILRRTHLTGKEAELLKSVFIKINSRLKG